MSSLAVLVATSAIVRLRDRLVGVMFDKAIVPPSNVLDLVLPFVAGVLSMLLFWRALSTGNAVRSSTFSKIAIPAPFPAGSRGIGPALAGFLLPLA